MNFPLRKELLVTSLRGHAGYWKRLALQYWCCGGRLPPVCISKPLYTNELPALLRHLLSLSAALQIRLTHCWYFLCVLSLAAAAVYCSCHHIFDICHSLMIIVSVMYVALDPSICFRSGL